jgi:hypothetical protein
MPRFAQSQLYILPVQLDTGFFVIHASRNYHLFMMDASFLESAIGGPFSPSPSHKSSISVVLKVFSEEGFVGLTLKPLELLHNNLSLRTD